ncbi:hypothetical protein KY343_03645 [Candidatus Woesearchaeota archaeon]|nr:hypothetical protein [Candidatus Woesearchaeota archaeon]
MKSTTQKKAEKMYTEDRVKLMSSHGDIIHFIVKGDNDLYDIHYNRTRKRWSCTCKGFSLKEQICSHIKACMLMIEHEKELLGL